MQTEALRVLVRQKLVDGRLPYNHIPRISGGSGDGETCDACDTLITEEELVMEGIASMPRGARRSRSLLIAFTPFRLRASAASGRPNPGRSVTPVELPSKRKPAKRSEAESCRRAGLTARWAVPGLPSRLWYRWCLSGRDSSGPAIPPSEKPREQPP
jgi:hypothetical protein